MIDDHNEDRRLGAAEYDLLTQAWAAPSPPSGFIDAVMRARPPQRRRRFLGIAAASTFAAAAALVILLAWPKPPTSGQLAALARTSFALAGRGQVVAEAGAVLRYEVAPGGRAHVVQDRGEVLYKVDSTAGASEHDRAFVVQTPNARVRVTGTRFRVTVSAAETAVAVEEGRVEVKDAAGLRALGPGQHVVVPGANDPGGMGAEKYTDFSAAEWAALSRRCALRMLLPPYAPALRLLDDEEATRLGFAASERAAYDEELQRFAGEQMAALIDLHRALVGRTATAAPRSYVALDAEIRNHLPPADLAAARRRYAEERAGLAPPRDRATLPALDRFIDLHASASERFEARLGAHLGAAKARAVRERPGVLKLGAQGCHQR